MDLLISCAKKFYKLPGLELMEHEECSGNQATKSKKVIPVQPVPKVEDTKYPKNSKGDDLLDHLELVGREGPGTNPIGGHLKTVLEKGYRPAC